MAKLFGEPSTEEAQHVVDQEKKRSQGSDWLRSTGVPRVGRKAI